jgi:Ras-related protein Rab-5C
MATRAVKLVLLGDVGVGKTSIVNRMDGNSFSDAHLATVGTNFHQITVPSTNDSIMFHVFDTAGEEKFRSLTSMFCQNANVVLVVFDVTVPSSFQDDIINYFLSCTERASDGVLLYLVGNKTDLEESRRVSFKVAAETAECINARYFETSALTGEGIHELFCAIAQDPELCFYVGTGTVDVGECDQKKDCAC